MKSKKTAVTAIKQQYKFSPCVNFQNETVGKNGVQRKTFPQKAESEVRTQGFRVPVLSSGDQIAPMCGGRQAHRQHVHYVTAKQT